MTVKLGQSVRKNVPAIAAIGIIVITCLGMCLGYNHTLPSISFAALGGIAGYEIRKKVGNGKAKVEEEL
jgi:uncharacterized membrane protein